MKKLILFFLLINHFLFGQQILETEIKISNNNTNLVSLFSEIEKSYPVKFYYNQEWISNVTVPQSLNGTSLGEALNEIFRESSLDFLTIGEHAIVIIKDPTQNIIKNDVLSKAATSGKKIVQLKIGDSGQPSLNRNAIIRGKVLDKNQSKPIIGATVFISDLSLGVSTNQTGDFEIEVPKGAHVISISYVNFEEQVYDLEVFSDGQINIELEEAPEILEDIVVTDRLSRDISTSAVGQTQIIMKDIKRAPALLGEVDIIRQIQTLAGVSTVGEAASGYNVRGGSVDQNLILYDGLPIFNSAHVFGFFSTFNAEAVRDVSFYRGGIPADYGGRVSSVLDIRSREGDTEKWKASAGIGFVSSNLLIEGPIKKAQTSVVASIRTTYSDWMINTIKSNYVDLRNSTVKFYDGTFKLTHKFNAKTKLTWSYYKSSDKFRLSGDSTFTWDTQLNSLKLDRNFNSQLSSTLQLGLGEYKYKVYDQNEFDGFNLYYKLKYPSLKLDFLLAQGSRKFIFGLQSIYYDFNPGTLEPYSSTSIRSTIQIQKQSSLESGAYLSGQFYILNKLFVDIGARASVFQSFGPSHINVYKEGSPRETFNIIDTLNYGNGKLIKSNYGIEPRLGLRYEISPNASIKLGFNRMFQYLHLVTNSTAITPVDIWQPSGYYFKPQRADQLSLGYFINLKERKYDLFVEAYYKKIVNVLDFKDGAQLILNNHLETDLLQGKSRAYGIESQISKSTGKLTGTLSYTFSRSLRTIQGNFSSESINQGKEYASNFDQPHVANLTWKYGFTRRHFFTGGFSYRTGRPITLPLNAFDIDGLTVTSFSERNKFRIPDYHRLDIGFVIEGNHKRKKLLDGTWTLSVYNVYGRRNPYTIFFKEVRPGILRPYRLAIIGTALPSITYSLKI